MLTGLVMQTCVEPFNTGAAYETNLITVEGTLTDLPEPQFVRLRRSVSNASTSVSQPVRGIRVEVLVDDAPLLLTEATPGDYALPTGFRGQLGRRYRLRFQIDGVRYESTEEILPAAPAIGRVYDRFDTEAIRLLGSESMPVFQPGHRVYLDLLDPVGIRNFYRWDWTLWERQDVCQTCDNGLYYYGQGCFITNTGTLYDYFCEQRCWAILQSRLINVMADTYSDGQTITGREAARIPFYNRSGALVEIRQQALTQAAFRYYKLLADQIQNTGSLADTPPASIFGNVSNVTNRNDKLVGFFTAVGVSKIRYWLSRENAALFDGPPLGLLGRPIQPEPSTPSPPRPPLAPCTLTDNRTPVQPEGWRD
jgi:hypothetical protein